MKMAKIAQNPSGSDHDAMATRKGARALIFTRGDCGVKAVGIRTVTVGGGSSRSVTNL